MKSGSGAEEGETILLVEDDSAIRNLLRRILEKAGYAVVSAATGVEAIRVADATEAPIDLVITDVIMPDLNGALMVNHLRERRPQLRVLYMSGYTELMVFHDGITAEGVDFLQKPFAMELFRRRVREALDKD